MSTASQMEKQVATLTKDVKYLKRMIHMLRKELDNCLKAEDLQCLVPPRSNYFGNRKTSGKHSNSDNTKEHLMSIHATVHPAIGTKKRRWNQSQNEICSQSDGTDYKKRRVGIM